MPTSATTLVKPLAISLLLINEMIVEQIYLLQAVYVQHLKLC